MPYAVIAREEGGHVAISDWLAVFKDVNCIFVGMWVLMCVCGGGDLQLCNCIGMQ